MNTTEELHKQLLALLKKIGKFEVELKKESIHVVHAGRLSVFILKRVTWGSMSFLTKARLLPGLTK